MIAVVILVWLLAVGMVAASVLLIAVSLGLYRGPGAHQLRMLIWPPRAKDDQ